jgi:hypothetical protein
MNEAKGSSKEKKPARVVFPPLPPHNHWASTLPNFLLISKIETKPAASPEQPTGLRDAFADMASALRIVESGDRAVPSQAIAVSDESNHRVKAAIAEWNEFKSTQLPRLNQELAGAHLAPIAISEIEQEVQFLMSR